MLKSRGLCRACQEVVAAAKAPTNARFYSAHASYSRTTPTQPGSVLLSRPTNVLRSQAWRNAAVSSFGIGTIVAQRLLSTSQNDSTRLSDIPTNTTSQTHAFVPDPPESLGGLIGSHTPQNLLDIGFLREAGLDFGWGPSTLMQTLLEYVHVYGGTPFWGSIVVTAFIVRSLVFPLIIQASETGARLAAMRPVLAPLQAKMKEAAAAKNTNGMQAARREAKEVYQATGIKLWKMALPFLQIPLGFGSWRVLRNMADLGVPGLTTGGFLWLPNLTIPDPYFITPFVCAAFQHLSMRMGGDAGVDQQTSKMRNLLMYALPALTPVFISFAPAAVQLSFTAAAFTSLCSTSLLRNQAFRRMLKLTPRVPPASTSTPSNSPYKGTMTVAGRVRPYATSAAPPPPAPSSPWSKYSPVTILSDAKKTITDSAQTFMPSAKRKVNSRQERLTLRKAEEYESKRSKIIDQLRVEYEKEQEALARGRRR